MNSKIIYLLYFIFFSTAFSIAQNNYRTEISVSGNYYEERKIKIDVYSASEYGFSISKNIPPHYSVPNTGAMTNGNLLVIHSLEGLVEVYDRSAVCIFQKSFYELPPYREQKLKFNINDQGIILFVSENGINKLYNINNEMNLVLEKIIEEGLISGISVSKDGQMIAYSINKWKRKKLISKTIFLTWDGRLVMHFDKSFKKGFYNEELSQFVGMDTRTSFCVDLENRDVLWRKELSQEELFIDALLNKTETLLAFSNNPEFTDREWKYENLKVININISAEESVINVFSGTSTDIKFKKDNDRVLIEIDGKKIPIKRN